MHEEAVCQNENIVNKIIVICNIDYCIIIDTIWLELIKVRAGRYNVRCSEFRVVSNAP